MTAFPERTLDIEVTTGDGGEVHVRIGGDLDWDSADDLTEAARVCLHAERPPRLMVLDCGALSLCDSAGLAALLMIHRIATAAGTRLRLDHRPALLERLLALTGTRDHLTGAGGAGAAEPPGEPDAPSTAGTAPPPPARPD
ncbi:STAS domain-containing protein [Streptomyces sp. I6]|uniref:STAS domain-containing protein n=1 Tax=Streptomyces sp. I6 TaxID=2483113 RepID=UPI000F452506|nr:STAS domain-containing protein [Streptomyces sp. I6]RNL73706.1 anti-sigma factor antagonist [Streptomyces sp. I6]